MNPIFRSIAKLYLGRIITPSSIDATPMQLAGGCPVVLFSPGFQSMNFLNTFYGLEFASHGFIVIGINHPGISAGTLLTNGSRVEFETIDIKLAIDEYEQLDSLFSQLVVRQADNLSLIVNEITNLNTTVGSFLYQNIDPCRIFAAGHSVGGAASFVVCGKDSRIAKGINLDGIFVNTVGMNYEAKELLLISSDREKSRPKDNTQKRYDLIMSKDKIQREQLSLKTNLEQTSLLETDHFDFTDLLLIIRPNIGKRIGFVGKMGGLKCLLETSRDMMKFFKT
jgi:Platelet-activating factor acetylhydrolase, isoform II